MSVATAIESLSARIQDAYDALSAKGATIPATKNSYNLSTTVETITELKAEDKGTINANLLIDRTNSASTLHYIDLIPSQGYNGILSATIQYRTLNALITPTTQQQIRELTESQITMGTVGYKKITVTPVTRSIDSNIQAENIKNGVTILGVTGNLVSGITPTGNIQLTSTAQTDVTNYATAQVVDADLVAGNIKKDVNILGVTGTYEGSGGGGGGDIVFGMSKIYYDDSECRDNLAIAIRVDGNIVWNYGSTGCCIKNPTTIQFSSDYWGDGSWLRLKYADGTIQDIHSNTTITNLTQSVVVQEYHGYSCLDGNTMILMKNGKEKAIADIKAGDEVACINPKTGEVDYDVIKYCDSDEEKWHDEKDVWTFDDGTELTTIHPHEFYNVQYGKFMYIADFKIGDKVLKSDKTTSHLIGHKNIKEKVRHFTLFTEKYNNYFANGILTGNRHSTIIKQLEG